MKNLLVSVVMITYKHEHYLKEAIEGVLMQQSNFEIELIISNDKSPDKTDEIVQKIIKEHPNGSWIKYNNHEINLGMMPNFVATLQQANGKYIALCEGDDYWSDPLKLQKQVDYLEAHDELSMCFHSVSIDNKMTKQVYAETVAQNRNYSIDELLLTKTAHTVSFVFKNEYLNSNLFLHKSLFAGDVLLALLMAEKGKVYGMSDNMGVYRMHQGGVTNTAPTKMGILHQKRLVNQFVFFRNKIKTLPKKASAVKIVDHCMTIAQYYIKKKSPKALYYLGLAVYYRPDLIAKGLKKIVR